MKGNHLPTQIKEVYAKVAKDINVPYTTVIDVMDYVWKGVSTFMAEDRLNAIYLRHLGTFWGKKEIAYCIDKYSKKDKEEDE